MPWDGVLQPPPQPYQPPRAPRRATPLERGELGLCEIEGHVTYPWEWLPLPGAPDEDLAPRTIRYYAASVTPAMHEDIRAAILRAYRQHLSWPADETPHITFRPYLGRADRTIVEVTMAHRVQFHFAAMAEDLTVIELESSTLRAYMDSGLSLPPTLVVLAVTNLPLDYDAAEVHNELWRILSEIGEPCEVWNVLLDHRAQNIWGQRTGKVVIVGHTFQTYFEDCLQERVPSTFTYRGNEYPLACRGGRPRPREAQHSSSTGVLAGENSDSGIEID